MTDLRLLGALFILTVAGCATPADNGKWTCAANGLVSASYNGSASAYVHLAGFSSGSTYPVKLNDAKTEATGVTGNGTPFVCKKSA